MNFPYAKDEGDLEPRVTYKSEEIYVDTLLTAETAEKPSARIPPDILKLTLVSEVKPPEHEGITLQATDIFIKDKYAYVSYNVAGPTFLGGVDIFNIRNVSRPRLVSSALFKSTDVSGISIDGSYLYLASAADPDVFPDSPYAILERITLKKGRLSSISIIINLPSYAATDVDVTKKWVFVTSGDTGGYVNAVFLFI